MHRALVLRGAVATAFIGGALAYYFLVIRKRKPAVALASSPPAASSSSNSLASKLASSDSKTLKDMVDQLLKLGIIKDERVVKAMMKVDRANYVPIGCPNPYKEGAVPIGFNATISAPHMHGLGLDLISSKLVEGSKVLDVGCGSGYVTACLADLVGVEGRAFGIDHVPELVDLAKVNIQKDNPLLFGQVTLLEADGFLGLPSHAPFDAIYVGAACPAIPRALVDQLKPGGRLVVPVGPPDGFHNLVVVDKNVDGGEVVKNMGPVRFVPLQSYEKQIEGSTIGLTKVVQGGDGENILMRTQYYPAPDSTPEEIKILRMQLTRPTEEDSGKYFYDQGVWKSRE